MTAPRTPSLRALATWQSSKRRVCAGKRIYCGEDSPRWIATSLTLLAMTALLFLATINPAFAVETIPVTITTAKKSVPLTLELATTEETRERGLMNRKSLAPNDGMLFQFATPKDYAFWMKDTLIPLDMVFINAEDEIVYIAPSVAPHSLIPTRSGQVITTIIELDGGRAAKEGIKVGGKVDYAIPKDIAVE